VLPENPGVPTINTRKHRRRPPWEVLSNNPGAPAINARKHRRWALWEVLPKNPRAPTINARKRRRWAPWEVLSENLEVPTINVKMSMAGPWEAGADGDPGASIINVKNIDGGPPGRCCRRI
jgi:hypothetical protein